MEIEEFAKWVKDNNSVDRTKGILAVVGFLCSCFGVVLMSGQNGIGFWVAGSSLIIIAAIEMGRYQWNRYLYLCEDNQLLSDKRPVSDVLRLHAFPIDTFFKVVRRKMYFYAGMILICSLFLGVFGAWDEEMNFNGWKAAVIILIGLLCAICIFVVGILKKRLFIRQFETGGVRRFKLVFTIMKNILTVIAEVIIWVIATPVSLLFLWGMISDLIAPAVEQSAIVFRNYNGGMSIIFVFVAVYTSLYIYARNKKRRYNKILYTVCAILFLTAGVCIIHDCHVYTEFVDEQFVVYQFGVTKTYDIEEIESFRIYEEHESIQMELSFRDGVKRKTIASTQTYSDSYEKKYFSEYNFIADYVEKLQKAGVSGEIKDVDDLRKDVQELDPECGRGLERIVELMES